MASKKALVFGGTSGIGLATARALAKAHMQVTVLSRDPSKLTAELGLEVEKCDVRDRAALATVFAAHAPYDVLISAATGGDRAIGPFLEMELDGFQASFDKLWGYANVVRLGSEGLAEGGNIVLVSGTPARRAKPGQIALASVGASVEQFVRSVAPELAAQNKRINVVSPGVIDTPMFGAAGNDRASKVLAATASHLVPRGGTAEEVATGIMFCVENEFVTGTTVDVDGGWLLH
jgi:NAD(P)-dependent dehydrogenase (short-subunit alcohol dehydrogenase family)